ncbi:hypothetical protein Plec18167_005674 [Paecilomyces lecythidis]|uniref:FAM192A/Fyv6 N-terminal domain-containing protein n=1 Tax=Paecilomyces lecythidis TaxID=3004212 RepID=A0ABR3XH12_9EURO
MSSGFVSAGTNEEPVDRDDEWLRAQQELEEERRRKAELGKQNDGKSLYEVLQQNKMAKQEAFEESIRLKNQFRSLDEDEVEFLDSLLESTRAKEAAVKKETAEQLEAFHRQRQEADKVFLETASGEPVKPGAGSPTEEEQWAISGRKRRRDKKKESLIPGKRRKSSTAEETEAAGSTERKVSSASATGDTEKNKETSKPSIPSSTSQSPPAAATAPVQSPPANTKTPSQPSPPAAKVAAPLSGLIAYSSDEDSS